jgi:arginase family enzyme
VVNLDDMPAVDYPATGGPPAAVVRRALDRVFSSGRVTALSVTSWNPQLDGAERSRAVALELLDGLL